MENIIKKKTINFIINVHIWDNQKTDNVWFLLLAMEFPNTFYKYFIRQKSDSSWKYCTVLI